MAALTVVFLLVVVTATLSMPHDISQNLIDRHLKNLEETRDALRLLRDIIDEADNNIEVVQKRSVCYIGGGMAHNCEYGEALDSAHAARHLFGDTPGKRGVLSSAPVPPFV